jgi:hypothetical protein
MAATTAVEMIGPIPGIHLGTTGFHVSPLRLEELIMKRKIERTLLLSRIQILVFGLLLSIGLPISPSSAQEDAKWFVLRHDQTGNCWTALLIEIQGSYRHAFAQKAGGPYETKLEARKREEQLEKEGTCSKN